MTGATFDLLRREAALELDQAAVRRLYRRHLNPALLALMELGGYAGLRVARAAGAWLTLADGRRLLDVISAYGALSHGHNHPRLLEAARWFDGLRTADLLKEALSPFPAALARNLAELAPGDLRAVFFSNSGTEAVEGALKLALRSFRGRRDRFVHAENSLHGKTLGSLQVTGRETYREHLRHRPDWPMVPFGSAAALAEVLRDDRERRIAGVILEPVQGEGGVVVPPPGYLASVQELCRRHGALLIVDEIQTGFGRTGSLFRSAAEGIEPDLLCVAKSLGGGFATIGATLARPEIQRRAYGRISDALVHTSTFGGRARATALALEALAVVLDEDFPGRARSLGAWLKGELEAVAARHPAAIRAVRGEGLMLGIEFAPLGERRPGGLLGLTGLDRLAAAFLPGIVGAELLSHGVLASFVLNHSRVLRIYPPLVATREDLSGVPAAVEAVCREGLERVVARQAAGALRRGGRAALERWLKERQVGREHAR